MIGIDEVGRGAWAGPLLVCAARLKPGKRHIRGLTDSKKLSKAQREALYQKIIERYDVGEGWVSASVIDEMGLSNALKSGCLLATLRLEATFDEHIILDGNINYFIDTSFMHAETMVKADTRVKEVSAAAIYAKVTRDNLMAELAQEYPKYNWKKNVGYGTAAHMRAIELNGITSLHRKSFKPIKS